MLQRAASRLGEIGCATLRRPRGSRSPPGARRARCAAQAAGAEDLHRREHRRGVGRAHRVLLSGVVTIGLTTARIATGVVCRPRRAGRPRKRAAAEAAAAGAAAGLRSRSAAGAAVGGAASPAPAARLIGVVVVNKVLQDDARLPPAERKSRAAARITGSVAATAASLGSGIAASVGGVGILAGGAVGAAGVAVAAAIPLAAAVASGFGRYGVNKGPRPPARGEEGALSQDAGDAPLHARLGAGDGDDAAGAQRAPRVGSLPDAGGTPRCASRRRRACSRSPRR